MTHNEQNIYIHEYNMRNVNPSYDTHGELVVQRYRQGIQLVKPSSQHRDTRLTLDSLRRLPLSTCFLDRDSLFNNSNNGILDMVGVDSMYDIHGRNAEDFWSKAFSAQLLANDQHVMRSESMLVVEETGQRLDDFMLHGLSFKLPWYYEEKVIGLFLCCIEIDASSLAKLANKMSCLLSTGLLGQVTPAISSLTKINGNKIYFSKRELDVLALVVKGFSVREISLQVCLSRRTVEHYIDNIKSKSGCHSKYELIYKYANKS